MIASEAGPAHLTVLIGFFHKISLGRMLLGEFANLDLSNDIEAIFPAGVCEVDSHKSIGNSVRIARCSGERITKVESWVWDGGNSATQNDKTCNADEDQCEELDG